MKLLVRSAVIMFWVSVCTASLFAQRVEIYPNGVGYLNHFEMKEPPNSLNAAFGVVQPTVYGVLYSAVPKGGLFLTCKSQMDHGPFEIYILGE